MSESNMALTYAVQENEGTWFQLWWNGQECVYCEDLKATTREDAEKEAGVIASRSNPLERVMEAMGCLPSQPNSETKG
jgi:hypothetical protein